MGTETRACTWASTNRMPLLASVDTLFQLVRRDGEEGKSGVGLLASSAAVYMYM